MADLRQLRGSEAFSNFEAGLHICIVETVIVLFLWRQQTLHIILKYNSAVKLVGVLGHEQAG